MKLNVLLIVALIVTGGLSGQVAAQQIKATASIDTSHILIGDQIKLRLELDKPKGIEVDFPMVSDSVTSKIEVVQRGKIDTFQLDDKNRIKLIQQFVITSFDTGMYQIPPFYFRLKNGQLTDSIPTQALSLQVHGMKIDTQKGPTDIKVPYEAPITLKEIIPYILGIILIGALIFFGFYYFQRKRRNEPLFGRQEKPKEPPHVIALRELDRVRGQKLWQQEKIKQYYSEISDILRNYIQERFDISALEQTSAETLAVFKKHRDLADEKSVDQLQQILSLADLVKFAKYEPQPEDNNMTLLNAYFFVNQTKKEEIKAPEKPVEEQEGTEVEIK
jgi:hypothetical protein